MGALSAPVRVRLADDDDLEQLAALERRCFDRPWPAAMLHDELQLAGSRMFLAGAGTLAEGYAILRLLPGAGELLRIGVDPERRRHGLGAALLAAVAEEVRRAGAGELLLEARADNREALSFYRRSGLRETGRRRRYYEDGVDAILWTLDLHAAAG
ncbi:MAG TPA: ribosomal protein S18-alanine N-acetyltransferase [Thermoanaerobaculia bacterium]|nr:ribosomal protein S18-alanine N-acetyltransferase [Thermoanaerobaculia bacterium]